MAVEVISDVILVKQRKRELCCKEYIRIITKEDSHPLVQLMASSMRVGVRLCPFQYINIMSRELQKAIEGCRLKVHTPMSARDSRKLTNIARLDIFRSEVYNKSSDGHVRQHRTAQ